ncbi:MAG TPA: dihydroorotase [Acidimicrobiia bacterium]|nr:dihydroorotase [Acidimicrobiia bacterium]
MIVIRGGSVLTGTGWHQTDVSIEGGQVVATSGTLEPAGSIDARGCLVGPAFVDLHTHLREPGQTWKEDIGTGSRAAAAGGYSAVVAMPNTDPPIDSVKTAETVVQRGVEFGLVDVLAAGTLTAGRAGIAPADLGAMYEAGVRMFTDDGDSVSDPDLMRKIMELMAELPGAVVGQHAEGGAAGSGHMHEGEMSRRLGVSGLPASAEVEVVRRDLALVADTGARYHCQHVSSSMTVALIREAKDAGLPVTAEVTPHHLTFTERDLIDLDPHFKMYPPLRTAEDRETLTRALFDGTIDAVATDHAPHTRDEKAVGFLDAPRGVIGMETAAAAVWEAVGDRDVFFRSMSTTPAEILDLTDHGRPIEPGTVANIVVFDPSEKWTPHKFRSKSQNSPYLGREMRGRVRATMHRGIVTYQGSGR